MDAYDLDVRARVGADGWFTLTPSRPEYATRSPAFGPHSFVTVCPLNSLSIDIGCSSDCSRPDDRFRNAPYGTVVSDGRGCSAR